MTHRAFELRCIIDDVVNLGAFIISILEFRHILQAVLDVDLGGFVRFGILRQLHRNHLGEAIGFGNRQVVHARHILEARFGSHCAVGDDVRHFLLAIFLDDPVEDFVAAFIVEVNVDIRKGDTVGVEETLKQQVVLQGIHIGDFQAVSHHRASGRATSGTYGNAHRTGSRDEVLHDEEVAREAHIAHHTQLKLNAFEDFRVDRVTVAQFRAIHGKFVKIVGFQFDTVNFLYAAQFRDAAFPTLAGFELGTKVFLGKLLFVALHCAELFGNLEHRHDGRVLQRVNLHLVRNFLRGGQRFWHIREYRLHLFGRFQPLLLGVVHTVGVVVLFARAQANQPVVGLAILLVHKVHVVGGNHLRIGFCRQAQDALIGDLLLFVHRAVATRLVGFMSLNLKIVVITEDALEPHHGILGFFILTVGDVTRHLARQTRGGDNQTFVILF